MYQDDTYYDADRYDSAADRIEDHKQKKLHEKLKQQNPELYCSTGALQSFPVNDWLREIKPAYRPEYLFGDLWRPGEVTVLAGETGVGKSILAVQIAESIARGQMPFREPQHQIQFGPATPPVPTLFPPPRRQRVLYFDLETSPALMRERYTCPSPILGKLPVSYRFANFFERSGYAEDLKVPEHFRGDMARYLRHSVDLAIRYSEANVIIIDDLAALEPSAPRSNGPARWLRNFRKMAALHGYSILVLTHLKSSPPCLGGVAALRGRGGRNSQRPLSLTNLSLGRQIAELADTVIAIGKTTYGPEYRYLKVLKSKNSPPCLGGVPEGRGGSSASALSSPPYQGGVAAALGGRGGSLDPGMVLPDVLAFQIQRTPGFSEDRPRRKKTDAGTARHRDTEIQFPASHHLVVPASLGTGGPFLSFTYLGPAAEQDLIRDHTAEALKAQREHERELKKLQKRTTKDILAEAIIDGSYAKYLKGE